MKKVILFYGCVFLIVDICSQPLKHLDLSWQSLQEIPSLISKHRFLRSLNVSYNPIKALPAGLEHLKHLESIDLIETFIQVPHEAIIQRGRMTGAQGDWAAIMVPGTPEVYWKCNHKPHFPDTIFALPKLKKVYISKFKNFMSLSQIGQAIAKGLDVRNRKGDTLLLYLIARKNDVTIEQTIEEVKAREELINMLLHSGLRWQVNSDNREGITPLMVAARFGDQETFERLMNAGADLNRQTRVGTALSEALSGLQRVVTNLGSIKIFLGPITELNKLEMDGFKGVPSPQKKYQQFLQDYENFKRFITWILDHKVVINTRDEAGTTPLMHAVLAGDAQLVVRLLDSGAVLDVQNKLGQTAFSKIFDLDVDHRNKIAKIVLARRKAFINEEISKDIFPLAKAIKAWLEAKENQRQWEPDDMERRRDAEALIDILLDHGADPLGKTATGISALEIIQGAQRRERSGAQRGDISLQLMKKKLENAASKGSKQENDEKERLLQ